MDKKLMKTLKVLLLPLLILLILFGMKNFNPYKIRRLFQSLGKGPDFLYVNSDKTMQGENYLPGAAWLDTEGKTIQAHGGQIQQMPVPLPDGGSELRYIWVGEDKNGGHFGNPVRVYSSIDLHNWEDHGDVLCSIENREMLDQDPYFSALYADYSPEEKDMVFQCINTTTVIERPKMLYNEKTGQYVIWFHNDDKTAANPGYNYDVGCAGVAVSDSPFGPFRLLGRKRLSICPKGQIDCFPYSKGEARDMNLFLDDDGIGYIVYTSENNKTLYISRLNEDFTDLCTDPTEAVEGVDFVRLFPGAMREAPVLIKNQGRYYLMSSSTTGWMSNQARVWSADEIFGKWKNDGNPCVGAGKNVTFDTQSTSLFQDEDGRWIYYGDRWNSADLKDSRYIWLPAEFEGQELRIRWEEEWK